VIWHRSGKPDLASIWIWKRSGVCLIKRPDLADLDLAKKYSRQSSPRTLSKGVLVDLDTKPIWVEEGGIKQNSKSQRCRSDRGLEPIWGKQTIWKILRSGEEQTELEKGSIGISRPIWL